MMFLFKKSKDKFALYVRNFVFGVEDSLVSTVGLLSGITVAGTSQKSIIITGIVLIFVEAFSMGVGSLLSEHSAEEYRKNTEIPFTRSFKGAFVMFFSYFFAGFIPLIPYLVLDPGQAIYYSILFSLIALFLLGAVTAKIIKADIIRHGFKMLFIGGTAVIIGVIVGRMLLVA